MTAKFVQFKPNSISLCCSLSYSSELNHHLKSSPAVKFDSCDANSTVIDVHPIHNSKGSGNLTKAVLKQEYLMNIIFYFQNLFSSLKPKVNL
ncbi:CLUMA_CG017740, isoform A [Clunio marinus]|uniref:CLUMA_CG017740, isoform A n=1 Tax=Clunio marinus TaxID=568069 RepID=A0A1J1IYP3_9DIPT|nr:CLUMA_CG017740, isoform A [Clunio marinus]